MYAKILPITYTHQFFTTVFRTNQVDPSMFYNIFCNSFITYQLHLNLLQHLFTTAFITNPVNSSALCNNISTTPQHIGSIPLFSRAHQLFGSLNNILQQFSQQSILCTLSPSINVWNNFHQTFHNRFCNSINNKPSVHPSIHPSIFTKGVTKVHSIHPINCCILTTEQIEAMYSKDKLLCIMLELRKRKGPKLQLIVCWRYKKKVQIFGGMRCKKPLYMENVVV